MRGRLVHYVQTLRVGLLMELAVLLGHGHDAGDTHAPVGLASHHAALVPENVQRLPVLLEEGLHALRTHRFFFYDDLPDAS